MILKYSWSKGTDRFSDLWPLLTHLPPLTQENRYAQGEGQMVGLVGGREGEGMN